jgi:hypothetical protein
MRKGFHAIEEWLSHSFREKKNENKGNVF